MATVQITADWESAPGVPLVAPAQVPTMRIRRGDTGALVVTDLAMTELGDGIFRFNFTPPVEGISYAARADGDPTAILQVPASARFRYGGSDDFSKEVWQNEGLDPAFPKVINRNSDVDMDEDVDAIHKDSVTLGNVSTQTRT